MYLNADEPRLVKLEQSQYGNNKRGYLVIFRQKFPDL